jgi:hypothetical protein
MPDILGGSYYGTETYNETAPGGAWDAFIGYDPYAPDEGYLKTNDVYIAPYESTEYLGGSDYGSAAVSTSDIVRSRAAGIPYPAAPINQVPSYTGQESTGGPGAWGGIFKTVVDIFGKSAVVLGGTLAANAIERSIPGRPSSDRTLAGAPAGLPARPFVLPSFLGGGTFSPTSGNIMIAVIVAGIAVFALALVSRR